MISNFREFLILQCGVCFTTIVFTDLAVSVTSKHTWCSPSVLGVTDSTDVTQRGGIVVGTVGEVDVCMSGVCGPGVTWPPLHRDNDGNSSGILYFDWSIYLIWTHEALTTMSNLMFRIILFFITGTIITMKHSHAKDFDMYHNQLHHCCCYSSYYYHHQFKQFCVVHPFTISELTINIV